MLSIWPTPSFWRSSTPDGVLKLIFLHLLGDFTPTLEDGNPTTHLLLFGEINAIGVELGEDDHTKVKYLTTALIVSRLSKKSTYALWLS